METIYQLVRGGNDGLQSEELTREELNKRNIITNNEASHNIDRLKGQPVIAGYKGPIHGGEINGRFIVRYETDEVYKALNSL